MDTNTMELNLNEMELVNGGSIGDHVLGALVGVGTGFFAGMFGGLAIAGPAGGVVGMVGGAVAGGVVGGVAGQSGVNNAIKTTKTIIKIKLADL
jgi:hypothetical protein